MFSRIPVTNPPPAAPQRSQKTGHHKSRLPAKFDAKPWHKQRSGNHAHIGSSIDDTCDGRALSGRKPFGCTLYRGGKVARFTQPEQNPDTEKPYRAPDPCVRDRNQAPGADHNRITNPCTDAIDEAPGEGK